MGFEIMGEKVFDFTQPFGYFEAFSGIIVVLFISAIGFAVLHYFRPKN